MGTPSEDDGDTESTVLGPHPSSVTPPRSTGSDPVDPNDGDAPTVILPRPAPRPIEDDHAKRHPASPRSGNALAPAKPGFAISIGTHQPIPLDVPAYVGRAPRAPRIVRQHPPRLVTVPSPNGEISGTHVGISHEADAVVVTDLGSTNGTTVAGAGSTPRTLRQGESLVVGEGAVVDIGDGIRIVIVTVQDDASTEGAQ